MAKSKAVVIGALLRVQVGNVNAGWPEGIVTVLKKVERPDGKTHPYISGQALRRYIRDTIRDMVEEEGSGETFSPPTKTTDEKAPIVTEGDPEKYVDDDLFGFMRAIKGATFRREAPLRVAPAFGIFPYTGDRDLGTRSAVEATGTVEAGGAIFETEVTNNIFRTCLVLELDRIGKWKSYETIRGNGEGRIDQQRRKKRAALMLRSLKYLWGGGRRSRFLVDMTPQFIVYARMTKKVPVFLHSLDINFEDGKYTLNLPTIREIIEDYKGDTLRLIIGIRSGFIQNEEDARKISPNNVFSVANAIEEMVKDITETELP